MELGEGEPEPTSAPTRPHPPAPLLPLAVGLILGITIDNFLAPAGWIAATVAAVGVCAALAGRTRRLVAVLGLLAASVGVGGLRHAMANRWLANDHIALFTSPEPMLVEVRGQVVGTPYLAEPAAGVPRAYSTGPKTHFVIEASQLAGVDGPITVSGKVAVSIKGVLPTLGPGDLVRMVGWVYRPPGPRNPGEYDWALHKRRNGLFVGLSCDHAESVIRLGRSGGAFQRLLDAARSRAKGYLLDRAFDENDVGAGVLEAMVLAQRSAVPQAMNQAFIRTGNAHFLAASGMNVAWLVVTGWVAMTLFGLHYRKRVIVAALLIASYVLLAEPQPSILRAGIMGLLWCASVYHRGRSNVLNWLACSAIILLLIDPNDCFRPGFQYSFMAVLALVYLYPRASAMLASAVIKGPMRATGRLLVDDTTGTILRDDAEAVGSGIGGLVRKAAQWLVQLFLMSLSAWFVTAPLSCYVFDQFTPWGAVNTCLLWFVAAPVTCWGYLTLLSGLLFPSSGVFCGPVLKIGTDLMLGLVQLLARVPGTILDGRSPSIWWVLTIYATLGLWLYRPAILRWKHGFKVAALLLLVWWLLPPRWAKAERDELIVWILAAGDGNAVVVEMPNGKVAICDFGTRSPFDVGRVGVSFLKHRGIRKVDAAFVSHPDFDHYSGMETISRDISVGRVFINDRFEQLAPEKSAAWQFLRAMREGGTAIEVLKPAARLDGTGEVVVEALWPSEEAEGMRLDTNDSSTVLRISYQGRSILLPGDITDLPVGRLIAAGAIHCDSLLLPHHGSVFGATRGLISAVDPEIVVRSAGQPRGMTTNGIESLAAGRQYFSTADVGCVRLTVKEGRLSAEAIVAK
jgi:competence protein ComEC